MDYIVDWARDIYRPNIIRQLKSVVDKGQQSSYTVTVDPDILSRTGYANSRVGDGPFAAISRAGIAEIPAKPAFDASNFTVVPSLKPLFESTGNHVDIRVWEGAKYESRVRGLYITKNDADAQTNIESYASRKRLNTVYMNRCWFIISSAQGIKTIEQTWTGLEKTKDVQVPPKQRILVSLYVQYRKDSDGRPIRELTYIALIEPVVKKRHGFWEMLEPEALVVSPEDVEFKLREACASSPENYFRRYASGQTDVLCVTASDYDKAEGRVVLSFRSDREVKPYARRLGSFIGATCENPRALLHKVYAPCFRYTRAVHSLTLKPYCIPDPTQDCVFINTKALSSGICAYIKHPASEKANATWVIRQLVQMVVVSWDREMQDEEKTFYGNWDVPDKLLLWIVSDPQWNLYAAIKPTLTMPGMDKVHERLTWFRKVLLRHKCGTGTYRMNSYRHRYRNVQEDIQKACKNCKFKESWRSDASEYHYCDEDFMPL